MEKPVLKTNQLKEQQHNWKSYLSMKEKSKPNQKMVLRVGKIGVKIYRVVEFHSSLGKEKGAEDFL